jgi:Fe-S cluster assembly protein SufB
MTLPTETTHPELEGLGTYEFGWADSDAAGAAAKRGLSEAVVRDISQKKNEPEWMLNLRLKGLRLFGKKPMPSWGSDLSGIDFDNIKYFVRSTEKQAESWEDLPEDIKNTYDRLGIPEAEKQRLVAGVAAQYESEVVYHQIREDLEEQGVIFKDTDTALREHPELFQEYFGTVIPVGDNKFASLNSAVWSGGSFIYVPKGVHVEIPLQAYFRINTENMGQFERTLIIVDEDAYVHYVEGCTAPIYSSDSLHSAVVEIIVKKGGRCRYTTIQNWSNNVYNLVTKRAVAYEGATMEWVDGNIGSKVTMKYPAVYLMGEHAKGETLSIAFAGEGQHQDAGAKMVHMAPNTSSNIVSKSVARGGGRTSYRGLIEIGEGSTGAKSNVLCDALLVDTISRSDTYPYVDDRLQGLGRPALLPDEPRHDRVRGDGDDRARLRRADRQGAADGVRAGTQPADRAADGRRGRLTRPRTDRPPHPEKRIQKASSSTNHG